MSGIYINGMDMPQNCWSCAFLDGEYGYCIIDGLSRDAEEKTNCPLIPIPDHGRLIDADALIDHAIVLKRDAIHAYEWTGKSCEWDTRITERGRFVVAIEDSPTIIPADKDGAE